MGFPAGSDGKKESACNGGDQGSIPGLGRSPGEGNGDPFQYSYLGESSWTEEPGRLQSLGLQRLMQRHDWATKHSTIFIHSPFLASCSEHITCIISDQLLKICPCSKSSVHLQIFMTEPLNWNKLTWWNAIGSDAIGKTKQMQPLLSNLLFGKIEVEWKKQEILSIKEKERTKLIYSKGLHLPRLCVSQSY